MSKLVWDDPGSKLYEAGIDRVVLYTDWSPASVWNGITSIQEAPSGGIVTPYYHDAFKYANLVEIEEYVATINAFTFPNSFGPCDGTGEISNGLFATQQKRKPFGLSYRTGVGNDISNLSYGYKIHLVYNALAAPSTKNNTTTGNVATPLTYSWNVKTKPYRNGVTTPTSHFIVDSRHTPPETLELFESYIYGSDVLDPALPDVDELISMFGD